MVLQQNYNWNKAFHCVVAAAIAATAYDTAVVVAAAKQTVAAAFDNAADVRLNRQHLPANNFFYFFLCCR